MDLLKWFRKEPKRRRVRQYSGAGSNRLLADWLGGSGSANNEIKPALATLRNRSRELARNHWIATRALQIYRTQVVGDKGLSLQVRARNLPQGDSVEGTLDSVGNKIIEDNWRDWTRRGTVEVTGTHSWIDCQKLVVESVIRDGEILIHIVKGAPNKFGFALQLLEADFLDLSLNKTLQNGNRIVMGVELNKYSRPVAYHLFKGPVEAYGGSSQYSREDSHVRIPEDNILHIYHPERAEQTRGVPLFANVLNKIQMLDGFEEAELVAARLAASKSLFLKSETGEGYDGDAFEDTYAPVMDAEPGSITSLPPGVDLAPWNPDHPSTAYSDYHKSVLRGIAAGLGLDYVSLSSNLEGVSYSSIRQGTIDSRDNYRTLQRFMIEHFAEPIYRKWLNHSLMIEALPFPNNRFDKFANAAQFRGRGYEWIDPAKEVKAKIDALNNGFITYSDVQAQYGRDAEEVFSGLQADKELAERYGIRLALEPLGKKAPALPEIDE